MMRVACAQLPARDLDHAEDALADAVSAIVAARRMGADLVVLPECTYPAYVLTPMASTEGLRPDAEVEALLASVAADNDIAVMVGLAQGYRDPEGPARNVGLLLDAGGREILRTEKRFLWDFDSRWFRPGSQSPIAILNGAAVGALVCADARLPEVARLMAVAGAQVLLDPTAWVTSGREPRELTNPQPEYLIAVRALENGVWIAAADKVGVEQGAVVYAGRSGIWAPDGRLVAQASADQPGLACADIDLAAAAGPPIARRPALYGALTRVRQGPTSIGRPGVSAHDRARIGLWQLADETALAWVERIVSTPVAVAEALGLDIEAFAVPTSIADVLAWLGHRRVTHEALAVASVTRAGTVAACAVRSPEGIRVLHPSHGDALDPEATLDERWLDCGGMVVAVMFGAEGLVPEVGRVLALGGADVLLWFADRETPMVTDVARTRATEERVYVAVVVPPGDGEAGSAWLVDPDGRTLAAGIRDQSQLVHAVAFGAVSRRKEVVPGTDVIAGRQPEHYGVLTS